METHLLCSLDPTEAKEAIWDVIVIGGGPAGSFAAQALAKRSLKVLIIDKNIHPRFKVCGCCVTPHGIRLLKEEGIFHKLEMHTTFIDTINVSSRRHCTSLPLKKGVTIDRSILDHILLEHALSCGASVMLEVKSNELMIDEDRKCALLLVTSKHHGTLQLQTKIVLNASGLQGAQFFTDGRIIDDDSYVGVGAKAFSLTSSLDDSRIYMTLGSAKSGYVGAVKLQDDSIDYAGALSPKFIKKCGSIKAAVEKIIIDNSTEKESLLPLPDTWKATPSLSCVCALAHTRYFAIGDACGYVEPFTGEGITWALESGLGVAPFAEKAVSGWNANYIQDWNDWHKKNIGGSHKICTVIKQGLRLPSFIRAAILRGLQYKVVRSIVARTLDGRHLSWI